MVYTDPNFPNTDYSVNGLNSDIGFFFSLMPTSVIHDDTKRPTPDHGNSINYNLISLKIIFDAKKVTFPSCSMNKLLGVSLIQGLDLLPCTRIGFIALYSVIPFTCASLDSFK